MGQRIMGGDPRATTPRPPHRGNRPPSTRPQFPNSMLKPPLPSPEDLSDSEETFPKDIAKWNSNDLMDKIEGPELEDTQGNWLARCRAWEGKGGGAAPEPGDKVE